MARLKAVNDAISELAVALATADDHMHLKAGDGVLQGFPAAGDYMIRIGTGEDFEIVRGTLRPSTTHGADADTIDITRAQEGTTARVVSWPIGTSVWLATTKGYWEELQAEIDLKAPVGAISIFVALSTATAAEKTLATSTYTGDLTADNVQLQAAVDAV
jgi:hypothetical protein